MILAIDVGNSHIVIGMIENGEIRNIVHLHTDVRETATEISIKLRQITDFYGLDPAQFDDATEERAPSGDQEPEILETPDEAEEHEDG